MGVGSVIAAALTMTLSGCAPLIWRPAGESETVKVATMLTGDMFEGQSDSDGESLSPRSGSESTEQLNSLATLIRDRNSEALSAPADDETGDRDGSWDDRWTLEQIVQLASAAHPQLQVARRNIELARSEVLAAAAGENPNFVFDVETPVYDNDDATEIETRVTFPVGRGRQRRLRCRAAKAAVLKAEAGFEQTYQRVVSEALAAAIRVIYLQQRFRLDLRAEQIAHDRVEAISQTQFDRDPAVEYLRTAEARLDAQQATRQRFATERSLAVARADLGGLVGGMIASPTADRDPLVMMGELEDVDLTLPPLFEIVAAAKSESAVVAVSLASLEESWRLHQLAQVFDHGGEIGPLYQDRLGRDDDMIGMRIETDLPMPRNRLGPIAAAASQTRVAREQVAATRHEVVTSATELYRELELLAAELRQYRSAGLDAEEDAMLSDPASRNIVAGASKLELELAIIESRRQRLEVAYRFALLRSQLELLTGGIAIDR